MDAWHEAQIARVTQEFDRAVGADKERLRAVLEVYQHTAQCTKSHRDGLNPLSLSENERLERCDSPDLKG